MKDINYFYFNSLSELHDGETIFFCKTDYLAQDFDTISKLNHDVILITGNSDYPITNDIVKNSPSNIKNWFATNALTYGDDRIVPIPLGLENKEDAKRSGHGISYPRATTKELVLDLFRTSKNTNRYCYANFNPSTNPAHRNIVKDKCKEKTSISGGFHESNLGVGDYLLEVSLSDMNICPFGNGVDTHRLYETLYLKRIPITIGIQDYQKYDIYSKLYNHLPIIILDSPSDLLDIDKIKDKYYDIREDFGMTSNYTDDDDGVVYRAIDVNFWKDKIKGALKQL